MRVIEAVVMFGLSGPGRETAAGAGGQRAHCTTDRVVEALVQAAAAQPQRAEPNGKPVRSNRMDGSGSRNISSIVPWIKPGRKSISSG